MYFHVSAYTESLGSVTNSDVDAVADEVLQRRNSHLIFSEPFNLIAARTFGTTLDRIRFGNIALSYRGTQHIRPADIAVNVPSRPRLLDRRTRPLALPINEEVTLEATTTGIGPSQTGAVLWLAKPQWNMNLPYGQDELTARFTTTAAAGSETTWNALSALAAERDLFNGVYAVVGAQVVAANAIAFRLFFPSGRSIEGRQLRPGGLVQQAIGDFPWEAQSRGLGEWGRFHTFELPSIQFLADAAGGTYDVYLDLVYLGSDRDLLFA